MLHEEFSYELFRERTKKLLEQYNNIIKQTTPLEDWYDVTLSVNCLYGLLMVVSEKYRGHLPEDDAVEYLRSNGIDENKIKISAVLNCHGCDKAFASRPITITFQDLITGIRNGLAHWEDNRNKKDYKDNVSYKKSDDGHVTEIVIKGKIHNFKVLVTATFLMGPDNNPIFDLVQLIP
ncbi:hypothetical protein AGMMS49942_27470 [Spirochaetia bacterium]|nr:hypothetical protein AGMMS49942_27470 [Spirochaetia bacterium]